MNPLIRSRFNKLPRLIGALVSTILSVAFSIYMFYLSDNLPYNSAISQELVFFLAIGMLGAGLAGATLLIVTCRSKITVYPDRITGQVDNPKNRAVMLQIDIPIADIRNVDVVGKSIILYTQYSKHSCVADNGARLKEVIMRQVMQYQNPEEPVEYQRATYSRY